MDDASAPIPASADRLVQLNRLATIARQVAGLAHELNNALQVVGGLVELLADRPDLPPDVITKLQRISEQADKASSTIRQVVGYSRELKTEIGVVDLDGVLEQILALRRYQLGRSGVAVTVNRADNGPARVRGDERAVVQALLNVVVNAEEARTGHQPTRELRIALARVPGAIRLRFEDTGPGVAPELKERIFEPFFSTRTTERALGLGLPVTRALLEKIGGKVSLADAATGATFVVEIPEVE
jgi:two-component system NtrC family sensor kinase